MPKPERKMMKQRLSTYLRQLEAESIRIMREVAAEFRNPVMLYSIGKDSSVMLHLALKAFYPAKPPFPLLHVDTTWKFREMIAFRDQEMKRLGLELIVHTNEQGVNDGIFMWATTPGVDGTGDNFTIQDNYLHAFTTQAANGHVDGIQTEGAKNGVIRHNTVDVTQDQNSAIAKSCGDA